MDALNDPLVQIIIAGVAGFFVAEWRRARDNSAQNLQTDASMLARMVALEAWQRDHSSIAADIRQLTTQMTAVMKHLDRLTQRFDAWLSAGDPPGARRSPYDFPGARDWVRGDEE